MMKKRGFTLVEILVVVSIIALVAGLTIPAIKAMQAGSARANALNTINAALQGVRSYAIMNHVKAAARFQPNGKVIFVYQFDMAPIAALELGGGTAVYGANTSIYLPVLNQEPLNMPNGYAASTSTCLYDIPDRTYIEPFYICYNPDGTLAVGESITVALVDTNHEPINPDFDKDLTVTWTTPVPISYNINNWLGFFQNNTDVTNVQDIDDRKLVQFFFVVDDANDTAIKTQLNDIFQTGDLGIDHYAGWYKNTTHQTLSSTAVTNIRLFKTPEDWSKLSLYSNDSTVKTKTREVAAIVNSTNPDKYEQIYINSYTGRIIRANQQ